MASTALGTQASGCFIGGTRKERRCFAAERGPDPFEHTRALEGPFFDPNLPGKDLSPSVYWSHTKRSALFCCRRWPRPPWAHKPPDGLLAAHERNGAVLLQNAAPTPLSTHEHSGVRFPILTPPGRDHSPSVYWSHTKRTALFCCRTWPRPPWAHKPPDGLLATHERNGAVLLQNAAPTPLGTHEHSRVRFSILTPGQGPQPGSPVRDPEIEAGFCHVKFFS